MIITTTRRNLSLQSEFDSLTFEDLMKYHKIRVEKEFVQYFIEHQGNDTPRLAGGSLRNQERLYAYATKY